MEDKIGDLVELLCGLSDHDATLLASRYPVDAEAEVYDAAVAALDEVGESGPASREASARYAQLEVKSWRDASQEA